MMKMRKNDKRLRSFGKYGKLKAFSFVSIINELIIPKIK